MKRFGVGGVVVFNAGEDARVVFLRNRFSPDLHKKLNIKLSFRSDVNNYALMRF